MLQRGVLGAVALAGLLAGAGAEADDRRYYGSDNYRSEPQIRLGIDILWGGYGYAPPPPVVWYPPPPPPRYAPYRGYDRGYGRTSWRGNGHRKHYHRSHHDDDCDD